MLLAHFGMSYKQYVDTLLCHFSLNLKSWRIDCPTSWRPMKRYDRIKSNMKKKWRLKRKRHRPWRWKTPRKMSLSKSCEKRLKSWLSKKNNRPKVFVLEKASNESRLHQLNQLLRWHVSCGRERVPRINSRHKPKHQLYRYRQLCRPCRLGNFRSVLL